MRPLWPLKRLKKRLKDRAHIHALKEVYYVDVRYIIKKIPYASIHKYGRFCYVAGPMHNTGLENGLYDL